MCGDLSWVADSFRCRRCDRTIQDVDLAEDLMVDGDICMCRAFVIWETLLMEMVERILLMPLESEMDELEVPRAFFFSFMTSRTPPPPR